MNKKELILEEKASKSRERKISRMCILCYKNCIRLHNDSILLFRNGSYPTAYAISVIALEEMGKYMTLSHGLFYNYFEFGSDEDFVNKVINGTYDHRLKQRVFANYDWHDYFTADLLLLKKKGVDSEKLLNDIKVNFEEKLEDDRWGKYFPNLKKFYNRQNMLEKEKHRSLYVGFPKKGRNADLSKRLISPFTVGKKKAENQITFLNDHLLLEALKVIKGVSDFDFEELQDRITPGYVAKLRKSWSQMSGKNRRVILQLTNMPDDKW